MMTLSLNGQFLDSLKAFKKILFWKYVKILVVSASRTRGPPFLELWMIGVIGIRFLCSRLKSNRFFNDSEKNFEI